MSEEKITVEITEEGEILVDLDGFKGKGCESIMDLIEAALGDADRRNKPEYEGRGRVTTQSASGVKNQS